MRLLTKLMNKEQVEEGHEKVIFHIGLKTGNQRNKLVWRVSVRALSCFENY